MYSLCCTHCRITHASAKFRCQCHTGRFFDHLLMISLDRTVSLPELHDISILIRHDLKFNMSRFLHVFFDIHRVISKSAHRFELRHLEILLKVIRSESNPHPFSTAPGRSLDHHRIADAFCQNRSPFCVIDRFFCSRNHRNTGFYHCQPCLRFISHLVHHLRSRSDERNITFFTHFHKPAVL